MALIVFIVICIVACIFLGYGGCLLYVSSAFDTGKVGLVLLAIGLFLFYVAFSNAPFTISFTG